MVSGGQARGVDVCRGALQSGDDGGPHGGDDLSTGGEFCAAK